MANIYAATVPQPSAPFLDQSGAISKPWLYFFIALQARSGGNTPIPVTTLQAQINSLFVEEAMNDDAVPNQSVGLSLADVMADDTPRVDVAPALLVGFLADPEPRPPLNPILAALFVSDAP